ncbi:MAG TPA: septum formation initiator family protein [Pseudonocardiaceae bacterium]|jgi:cell division protein FtsB|nr:septum formation initiator family protein [Pseudonocardiaceae bacterium]
MTGRDQQRRRRRGETSGGASTRRVDRSRRAADAAAGPEPDEAVDTRRATRGRRPPRRPLISRAVGRLTTRRAALLALVVCALALSVAVPLHTYLSQRDDLQAQLQQQQALRTQESALEKRERQLSDPAQIEAEAKTRLRYVMPGEIPYDVQLPGSSPVPGQSHPAQQPGSASSWYQTLWNSIVGNH